MKSEQAPFSVTLNQFDDDRKELMKIADRDISLFIPSDREITFFLNGLDIPAANAAAALTSSCSAEKSSTTCENISF